MAIHIRIYFSRRCGVERKKQWMLLIIQGKGFCPTQLIFWALLNKNSAKQPEATSETNPKKHLQTISSARTSAAVTGSSSKKLIRGHSFFLLEVVAFFSPLISSFLLFSFFLWVNTWSFQHIWQRALANMPRDFISHNHHVLWLRCKRIDPWRSSLSWWMYVNILFDDLFSYSNLYRPTFHRSWRNL